MTMRIMISMVHRGVVIVIVGSVKIQYEYIEDLNPLTAEWALRALIDFTLSNARRFYSSMGNPLDGKGLIVSTDISRIVCVVIAIGNNQKVSFSFRLGLWFRRLESGMNCFKVIASEVAWVGKRARQSSVFSFTSSRNEKNVKNLGKFYQF